MRPGASDIKRMRGVGRSGGLSGEGSEARRWPMAAWQRLARVLAGLAGVLARLNVRLHSPQPNP